MLLATAVSYRAVWSADFVYEDNNGFPGRTIHEPWRGLATEFDDVWRPFWRGDGVPVRTVTGATYRLNAAVWPSAVGYHVGNLAFHLLNAVLLLAVIWPLLEHWSIVAAGWFALYPLQSEAVMGVAYRGELVAAMFVLLAFLAGWRVQGWPSIVLATVCGLLALLAKETTAAVLVLAWPALGPTGRRVWPWLVWCLFMVAAVVMFWGSPGMLEGRAYLRQIVLNLTGAWVLLARAIVPAHQTIDLDLGHGSALVVAVPAFVLLLSSIWVTITVEGRVGKWLTAGLAWVLLCLCLRVLSPSPELVHEHAMYLPVAGIGVSLAAAWGGVRYPARYFYGS